MNVSIWYMLNIPPQWFSRVAVDRLFFSRVYILNALLLSVSHKNKVNILGSHPPPHLFGGGLQAKFWIFVSGAAKKFYFWGDLPLLGGPESSSISSGGLESSLLKDILIPSHETLQLSILTFFHFIFPKFSPAALLYLLKKH